MPETILTIALCVAVFITRARKSTQKLKMAHVPNLVSLRAQLVKFPPAMQETWVQSLGWEDPLEKGTAIHSSILAERIPWAV